MSFLRICEVKKLYCSIVIVFKNVKNKYILARLCRIDPIN